MPRPWGRSRLAVGEVLSVTVGDDVAKFNIPSPAARPSAFAFSLHKAGSVLLDKVMAQLAKAGGVPAINFPSDAFRQGLTEGLFPRDAISPILMRDGYMFTGFRALQSFIPDEALAGRRKLLLIRDPRDMLVSLYFSHRYSHYVPSKGPARDTLLTSRADVDAVDIDTFVLSERAEFIAKNYRAYMRTVGPDWRVYRYEDVVFRKREWLADMAAYLDLPIGKRRLNKIADKNDVRPEKEDVRAHVRQVTPGNYRRHLQAETISILDSRLGDILRFHQRPSP